MLPDAQSNQMLLNGPVTATLRPGAYNCSATAGSRETPILAFSSPAMGEVVKAGTTKPFFWSNTGRSVSSVRIRLSSDGGATYPLVLADGAYNNGYFNWSVPANTVSTSAAHLKIEGLDAGRVVALTVSPYFTIDGVPAPAPTAPPAGQGTITAEPYDYDPATETLEAETIGVDRHLKVAPIASLVCNPETRIKAKGMDTLYYCGRDGKRYVFPNKKTHDTWYDSFNGVVEIALADMQKIPLGGNVTYRPGSRLVKITTSPEVFAVAADGILRYVSEAAAIRLYGPEWNKHIDDIPDAFFADYQIGTPVK
jgi:hypothetical protein